MSSRARAIKPALTALAVLVAFILAFVAFILAPLLMVALVAGSMWAYERWQNSRRQSGVRSLSVPRSVAGAQPRREGGGEQSYGFGSGVGRDL